MTTYTREVYATPAAHFARANELEKADWTPGRGFKANGGWTSIYYKRRPQILNPPGLIGPCWDAVIVEWHAG